MCCLCRVGRFFFRTRDRTPVPFAIAVALGSRTRFRRRLPGIALLATGLALRLWAVRHIGPDSRSRGHGPRFLARGGPYTHLRHPLYAANAILSEGLVLTSGTSATWLPFLFPFIWLAYYLPIIIWEDYTLSRARLPERRTPFSWRTAVQSERRTYQSVLAFLLVSSVLGRLHTKTRSARA